MLADSLAQVECEEEFGIDLTGLHVTKGKIQPNQFLADILLNYEISYPEIDKMVRKAKPLFDVRRIAAGKDYTILYRNDSTERAEYFIYEESPVDYVLFHLRDTFDIYRGSKPVELVEREVTGVVESSLYEAMMRQGASPSLAMELSEIYAWSVDFYRIQKGDFFKIVYTEKMVEGQSVGIGEIKASLFNHWGEDNYAFQYEQEKITDYFDETGMSLRKAFLQAPLKFSRISSGYTMRRFHPVQKRYKAHLGTDYAAPTGTPIMSVGDGTVIEARYSKYNGNYVKVKHNGTYTTQYLHMSKIASGMKPGQRVKQGDVIGYVGSTGLATGPHVCFRFWKNGKQVDHRKEKLPASDPIKPEYKEAYEAHMQVWKARLDEMELSTGENIQMAQL